MKKALSSLNADIKVQAFSSLKYTGKEQADAIICEWLEQEAQEYELPDESDLDNSDESVEDE